MAVWTVHNIQSYIHAYVWRRGTFKEFDVQTVRRTKDRKKSNIAGAGSRFSYLELTLKVAHTIRSVVGAAKESKRKQHNISRVDDAYLAAHPWFTEFLHIDIPTVSGDTKQISSCLYTWPKNEIYTWTNKSNNNKLKSRKKNTELQTVNDDSFAIMLEDVSR